MFNAIRLVIRLYNSCANDYTFNTYDGYIALLHDICNVVSIKMDVNEHELYKNVFDSIY